MPNGVDRIHVVCYRWGTLYSVDYVNRLYAMVKRNLDCNLTFHCVTDSFEGLNQEIVPHEIPDLGIEGIWRKLMTFQKDFLGLEGELLVSFDIDVVIVGSLNFLLDRPEEPFIIAKNWGRKPGGSRGSGSVYRLRVGSQSEIWDDFISDPNKAIDNHHGKNRLIGEQKWLNAHFDEFVFFPDEKVVSFKRHCHAKGHSIGGEWGEKLGLTTAIWGKAAPPPNASVVSFHGDPLPVHVRSGRYGRWRHAPFVQQHWKE